MKTPWIKTSSNKRYPQLTENLKTQTCIIGGGITGLTIALLLLEKGQEVVLLERNNIAEGVTGHTSGHLTSLIDYQYQTISSTYSKEVAREVYSATIESRELVERLIEDYNLDIGYETVPGYYYATDENQVKSLEQEKKALEDIGVTTVQVKSPELPFVVEEAFRVDGQAIINAAAFVQQLAEVFVSKGGQIFENSPVEDFEAIDNGVEIKTKDFVVTAEKVVQATHTPLMMNPLQLELNNYTSYVIAAETNIEVKKGIFYDFAEPYHYIRNYEENGKSMYVIGGKDSKTGSNNNEAENLSALQQYGKDNWGTGRREYEWCSMVFESSDSLPFIGKDPMHKNAYVATGFSGDGLTFGLVSAILNSALILSNEHKWKDVFNPKRLKLKSMSDITKKGFDLVKHTVIDGLKKQKGDVDLIAKGEGKLLTVDGEKVGIYRDEENDLHIVNPICSHMKCVLNWNPVAKTWDCGCHGSRYDPDGEIVSGPSIHNLEKVNI